MGNRENVDTFLQEAISLVLEERVRQRSRYNDSDHDIGIWLALVTEELGEVSRAFLSRNRENFLRELVQLTALALAWIETEIKNKPITPP